MRRFLRLGFFLVILLFACAPQADSVAEPTGVPSPTLSTPQAPAHAEEIRFGLIGEARQVNAWELFDGAGSTYNNRALFSEAFPRLYHLAPPESIFQPLAAEGQPSDVVQDGDGYSATVKLRADLKWTDGSPFTAEDVAFTANTILQFEFGYDWGAYYPLDYLARAEAIDSSTVKFIFKQKPNVGVWQYGVLQAPIVQKAFWTSSVQDAADKLPDETLLTKIAETRARLKEIQAVLDNLTAQVISLRVNGWKDQKIESDYTKMQGEVFSVESTLQDLLDDYASQVKLSQEALHELDNKGEPSLGVWISESRTEQAWVYKVNPAFPFGTPNFDRASYRFFEDEQTALAAFQNGDVDFILSPVAAPPAEARYNPSNSARFLVFNPSNAYLADPSLRSALACMIDRDVLTTDVLQNKALPLDSFVLSPQWHDPNVKVACDGMAKSARMVHAVELLKNGGYSWRREPGVDTEGQNLTMSNGEPFPKVTLLAPSKVEDAMRYATAKYIAEQAQALGIPFAVREVSLDEVFYTVYSSRKYDMALMGWRLSEYPAYLCEWANDSGEKRLITAQDNDRFGAVCGALEMESSPEAARQAVTQIESELMSELSIIPLFTLTQADVYRNLAYPVTTLLNGWTGWYGAPSYAVPAP